MEFKLVGNTQHLIHILRVLMLPNGEGVIDRMWEFRSLFAQTVVNKGVRELEREYLMFPELEVEQTAVPFQVTGIRLVERSSLVFEFEETELVRLCTDDPTKIDMKLWIDSGNQIEIETNDADAFGKLDRFLQNTSGPQHKYCFW